MFCEGLRTCSYTQYRRRPESSTVTPDSTFTIPLSPDFCADDADVIIRVTGTRDFRAHRWILSLVSPKLKKRFNDPEPPHSARGAPLCIDVHESAEAWEGILRTIYPMPNPTFDNPGDLSSLLFTALEYEMQPVIDVHAKALENHSFIQRDPLPLYAIACACGLEDQAKFVARNSELLTVAKYPDASELSMLMSLGSYHRLISFLVERDSELHRVLIGVQTDSKCDCDVQLKENLYSTIRENLERPHLQADEIYLGALEDRSRYFQPACTSPAECDFVDSNIKAFVEGMVRKREWICDNLLSDKRLISPRGRWEKEARCVIC